MIQAVRSTSTDPRPYPWRERKRENGLAAWANCLALAGALALTVGWTFAAWGQAPTAGAAPIAATIGQPLDREADPFYLTLFDDGMRSLSAGDEVQATRELRLACFGFLEQPTRLGACLAYLGIAQARQKDRDGFNNTFQRLAAVETAFQGYSQATVPKRVQAELSRAVALWIPAERLASIPSFASIAEWQEASRLARLPAREIRAQLTARREEEPNNTRWTLMLADLELAEKKTDRAGELVAEALRLEPGNPRALCTRGLIRTQEKNCAGAVEDLTTCARARQDAGLAEALLSCQLELGRRDAARELIDELAPDVAADRRLAVYLRQLDRGSSSERAAIEPINPGPAPGSSAEAERNEAVPAPAPAVAELPPPTTELSPEEPDLSPEERSQLEQARLQAREAREISALLETLGLAQQVADAHPGNQEAQHVVTEIAYRSRHFDTAVEYFRRGGEPETAEPFLLFFYAVSLYETGEQAEAADVLRKSLPGITMNTFVESYKTKILGAENAGG